MRGVAIVVLILAIAAGADAATIDKWNGVTLGASSGNISKWNWVTVGTSSGNIGQLNGMTSPSGGSPPTPTVKRLLESNSQRLFEDNTDVRYLETWGGD